MPNDPISRPVAQHVFVDFENVKTLDLGSIDGRPIDFEVVYGPQGKKLDLDLVAQLMAHSGSVKLVKSPRAGKDAADFVVAFYLGQSVLRNPGDGFHVISGDTGFDSLVDLLESQGVSIKRHKTWDGLTKALSLKQVAVVPAKKVAPAAKKAAKKVVAVKKVVVAKKAVAKKVTAKVGLSDNALKILKQLNDSPTNRPKNHAKLAAHVASRFKLPPDHENVVDLIKELEKAGFIGFTEGKASYHLPG